jgi:hypothetical protein
MPVNTLKNKKLWVIRQGYIGGTMAHGNNLFMNTKFTFGGGRIMKTSKCCGAKIILTDICSECKEHAEKENKQ